MSATTTTPARAPVAAELFAAVDRLFTGRPILRAPSVGVELELIPFRPTRGSRPMPVGVGELRTLLSGVPFVAFEPGGQIELNPPPRRTAVEACDTLASLFRTVVGRLRSHGIHVIGCGLNPWHSDDEVGLQLRSDRYLAMDRHFERIGPSGRSFMRRTASTQICIDLATGDDGRSQWRAANLVAPLVAAMFANAPLSDGVPIGDNGRRTAITLAADAARMGHGRSVTTGDPVLDYATFAAGAAPISEDHAGRERVEQHLSTLFPPVRPRSTYLEIRAIDSLPLGDVQAAVALTATLLADRRASDRVERLAEDADYDHAALWQIACAQGVRVRSTRRLAVRIVDIALASMDGLPAGYLPDDATRILATLRERVSAGLAPGDVTAARWGL